MSDFNGMGGAVVVCLIAQSIVFLALAAMAGVIRLVGVAAGEKQPAAPAIPIPATVDTSDSPAEADVDGEVTAAIMAALSVEMAREGKSGSVGPLRPNAWRLVSLQEASRSGVRI